VLELPRPTAQVKRETEDVPGALEGISFDHLAPGCDGAGDARAMSLLAVTEAVTAKHELWKGTRNAAKHPAGDSTEASRMSW
jgi:hypothetical protein